MVLGLRPLLSVYVILSLSFHRCRALDNNILLWAIGSHSEHKTLGPDQLMECESLNISLSSETNKPSSVSYHVLAFEPRGKATVSLVCHEPSSLHWTVQHPAGTQLFLALLDSFNTFLGALPAMYIVAPGSTDCLTQFKSPVVIEAFQPQISSSVFNRLMPRGTWEISFSGGKPPYSVSIVALKSGSVYNYFVPSGEHILSYTSSRELSGQVVVLVSDANGTASATSSIIDIADTQDTPSADSSDAFSTYRPAQPRGLPFRLRKPPRSIFRLRRTLPDHPHMQLSRDWVTTNTNHADTIIFAVCVSLGGAGIAAVAIYAIRMYRQRRKLLDAQDTLPRPFEVTVLAATTTSTSMRTHDMTSPSTLGISRRICSPDKGRVSRYEARRKEFSAKIKHSRAGSAPTSITTAPLQSQPGPSRNTRMQPHLSDASLRLNQAGPSFHRAPPCSWTYTPTLRPTQPGQSSSVPTGTGVFVHRSVREQRSTKRALWILRSASELHSATPSARPYRFPEYDSHGPRASSGRHTHRHDEGELRVDTLLRPTNHWRQWHSASSVVHVQPVRLEEEEEEEEGVGTAVIFQHQDAGVMQELPPPYHKLVRSSADV